MSQHTVEVVRIKKEPHGNADSLSLVQVRGFQVVVRSDEWEDGALAAYIEPDMVMPDGVRVRPRKLRGVWSMGMLVPAPEGAAEGADVAEALGVTRYAPPEPRAQAPRLEDYVLLPNGIDHVYDVENYRRYPDVLTPGEIVMVTEKIHGTNARFTVRDGQLFVGSRRQWLKENDSIYWRMARQYPQLGLICHALPGATVYGEIYGAVQDLRYGHAPGAASFAAFDILRHDGTWIPATRARNVLDFFGVPKVPYLGVGPFRPEMVALADAPSAIGGGVREGVVIRPIEERQDPAVGRVILKVVSNAYLERAR